ncbi:hypothetical protein A3K48_06500 [candidate division WOR-1 bacterium RIFOXYA12_FULL_52_29]|uniref:Protochlamydia outer membrane protein domain-containing protein n=1 Tax=candidate division WOR-1 bacterium RIFOXYC12_FULL_54_18 TaxID=1802584 RepID=A0A1F4T7S6_UNCSA|nr:MAG: hypothetical protein A3K44_06500 [candidate division WOR-1 bacterium RIFOXYA2_FULL_51_19]OGC18173.1 MAG: hypothetical protein A3K48_06500 [candidate division WOR-1 bacterium RIFOXYA12_FULL_52_29]OGC27028.1 MAG: hypothetical protein A3K32_06495 [candidate division WOR-1 bacterium RIFOXYB2_FULL_45_9]OGC28590.1 MAG: hypothetical protein A3K49_06500 [candidate division WOR-1 bacterium RIFOXYC12_FULL_54_18]OGC30955.1 MAG: hypothetical protein A2346_06120 [candidate division WOR-1 bacterium R
MRAIWLLFVFSLMVSRVVASPRFFSSFDFGPTFIGYQEQVLDYTDPATSTVGRIDSTANPVTYALRGSLEMYWDKTLLGLRSVFPVYAATVKESWSFNGSLIQTNDLTYAVSTVDFYGGYSFAKRFELLSGFSMAKAEQNRENFYVNGVRQNIDRSTETILSQNVFLEARGKEGDQPLWFGYQVGLLYPLNVTTTNTLLPNFQFSSPGYTYYGRGSLYYLLSPDSIIEASLGYRWLHYDGSNWLTIGSSTAKWPMNNTSELTISLGWLYSY